jgi:sugar porter (SP) family MFS transporter
VSEASPSTSLPAVRGARFAWVVSGIAALGGFLFGYDTGVISDLSEVAPPAHRGRIVSANQLMVTAGIVIAYLVDYAFSTSGDWRAMFGIAFVPAALLGLGMLAMPESPRFLAGHGREDDARDVLERMLGTDDKQAIDDELAQIDRDITRPSQWRALLAPNLRRVLIVGVGLAILQQITGINTVIYFAPTLLHQTGLGSSNAILNSIPIGAVNLIVTIISLAIIDRVGRRRLLVASLTGMAVTLVGLAIAFQLSGSARSDLALTFLILYVGSFAIGFGPVFWLLISEIYPSEIRGEANSVATAANWLANFGVALTFLSLVTAFGQTAVFGAFAVLSVLAIVFTLALVPETRERSLEEIEHDLGTLEAADDTIAA